MQQCHMMNGKLNQNGKYIRERERKREIEKMNGFLIWTSPAKKLYQNPASQSKLSSSKFFPYAVSLSLAKSAY